VNDTGCTAAITTDAAPAPVGACSQGRIAGPFVFTAGLRPLDRATGQIVGTDVATQASLMISHFQTGLCEADVTLAES
jgi:2-iminobutanoate/2-iminopropanoate deaminase